MAKKNKPRKGKFTGYYPGDETPRDAKAANVDIRNEYTSGKDATETKIRDEKVTIRDTATGKTYGTRTLAGKATNESLLASVASVTEAVTSIPDKPFTREELREMLPDGTLAEIKNNIRKGAKDLSQDWSSAIELCQKAYQVSGIDRPAMTSRGAWKQYEDLVRYAVQQLKKFRGLDGKWRLTKVVMVGEA